MGNTYSAVVKSMRAPSMVRQPAVPTYKVSRRHRAGGGPLGDANLGNANLTRANLVIVVLSNANLSGAQLSQVNLSGAGLRYRNITPLYLATAAVLRY